MNRKYTVITALVVAIGLVITMTYTTAQTRDMGMVERGRYLVRIAGCNDCHTPGYLLSDGEAPESVWLTGDSFGWRGPWGTTYPKNLRKLIASLTEDQWVILAQNLRARPPMPWFNLNRMAADDLRAVYQYVKYLGPAGNDAPDYVPPDKEPEPPYAVFPSPPPE